MNIALISLYQFDNYAIRLLSSYLNANNISVKCINFKRMEKQALKTLKNDFIELHQYYTEPTEEDINALIEQITILNPALIGMNVRTPCAYIAIKLTQEIKKNMDVPVIWGGAHPTSDPENSIKYADIICLGEGFIPLLELSKRISTGKSYSNIQNLWIKQGDKIIQNEKGPLLKDLDNLPIADYDKKNQIYIEHGRVQKDKNFDWFGFGFADDPLRTIHQTMTSFGCPMKCSYCLNCITPYHSKRRSVSSVINELTEVKRKNPYLKLIIFHDDIFQMNKTWCMEFSKEYREKISLPFFAYTYPSVVDMETLIALKQAGWAVACMGIQSGSYRIRKEIYNRHETNEQIINAAKILNKGKSVKGIRNFFRIYYDFITFNPLEKESDLKESLDLILKLPKGHINQSFTLSFYPNFTITKNYQEKGLITEKDIEGNRDFSSLNNARTGFDSKRKIYSNFDRLHTYYYLLACFAQFRLVPNYVIKMIEKKKLFYNKLNLLFSLCRIIRNIELNFNVSNYSWIYEMIRVIPLRLKIKYKTVFRFE